MYDLLCRMVIVHTPLPPDAEIGCPPPENKSTNAFAPQKAAKLEHFAAPLRGAGLLLLKQRIA